MKKSSFDEIPVLSPEQSLKEREIESKGYQYYRDSILRTLANLTFFEKYKIIKKVDRDLLVKFNTHQGTKVVHTLDYMHKIPSRKKNLTKTDEIILLFRDINMVRERDYYYKVRKNQMIRVVK